MNPITRRNVIIAGASATLVPGLCRAQGSDLIRFEQMGSAFIDPRNVHVWLPPGYGASARRYPVIYMHDGQNLFVPAYGFRGQCWEIDAAMGVRADALSAIIVGIWNTSKRRADYSPTAIEAHLPEALRSRIAGENAGPSLGDAYLRFIVEELKPVIDRTFRTQPNRKATCIMGSSRGGMISLYGLCQYPEVFGAAACLSTHWLMSDAFSAAANPATDMPSISAALVSYLNTKLPSPRTHKIWMDHGSINLDSFYAPYQTRVDAAFIARGWRKGRDFESRVYAGADHNEAAWRARLDAPLDFILAKS